MTTSLKPFVLALAALAVACGDDANGSAETGETDSSSTDASTTDAPTTDTPTGGTTADTTGTDPSSTGSVDTDEGSSGEDDSTGDVPELSNIDKAVALIDAFETGDPTALDYVSESYIQHNLAFPDGKDVLVGLLAGIGRAHV